MFVQDYLIKKNIILEVNIKPKNDMMYQDICHCICKNTKNEDILSIMSNLQPNYWLKVDFQKLDQHAGGKWLIHDTKRRKAISCIAWNSPAGYPSRVARCDIKGSDGTMLNPIFWKKVHGQKHPRRWEIAERQIPSIKMLFKTNTKGHKHPSIRLFIKVKDTIGKPKKTKSGIQPRNRLLPRNTVL